MNSITEKAYAKINLGLDVIRKRPDGYHDVSMIMQLVNLHDTISIKKTKFQSVTVRSNYTIFPRIEEIWYIKQLKYLGNTIL